MAEAAKTLQDKGVSETIIDNEMAQNTTLVLKSKFLASQLKAVILRLWRISDKNVFLFWIGILILLSLNGTIGFSVVLGAIRQLVKEGLVPEEVLNELEN